MKQDTREIEQITFGIYSANEILDMAVCKIDNPKKNGPNTVYDDRMGTTDSTKVCQTCKQGAHDCQGHFGYIELNESILHPLYYKRVVAFLNCFCLKCCRLLLLKDQIYLAGLNRYKGESRFIKIRDRLKKVHMCCHPDCGADHPRCKFSPSDSSIFKVYEGKDNSRTSIMLTTEEIRKIFDSILDEDVRLIGLDPTLVHPRNLVITVLPVMPPCDRPYVQADGNMCDDDITNQYCEIIKANNHLGNDKLSGTRKELSETKRQKFLASLRFRILTTFNNGQGKAKHTTNGRAIKGIKERLAGKDGQLRNNMMGKRSVRPDTPVLMFSTGKTKRAEDIVVGDVVVGDDGKPRTVIDTVTGESPLYKVKQSHGDDYGISCEHILTLKYCGHSKIHWRTNQSASGGYFMSWYDRQTKTIKSKKLSVNSKNTKDQCLHKMEALRKTIDLDPIVDIHVKDYLKMSKTKQRLMMGVKLRVPIQWPEREVPMDPRILGMWLGDGHSYQAIFTNPDKPLIEYFKAWTEDQGGKFRTHKDGLHHGISYCGFLDLLRENNLYKNKHIPEVYIVNSEKVRLEVLAGLIDTDGSVEQEGRTIRLIQCVEHKAIIDGAQRIARSLGFRASIHEKKTSNGERKKGIALELTISGAGIERIQTLLPRKKCSPPRGTDMCSTKIEIVEDGVGKFCGFEVDQNNRFLLGDCTITHNCNQTGRTVIGPDPTLKLGQLAVPPAMADILTIPVRVASFNIDILQKLVDNGRVNSLLKPDGKTRINLKRFRRGTRLLAGDVIYRGDIEIPVVDGRELVEEGDKVKRAGKFLERLAPSNRSYRLKLGWIAERKLQDDDYVLLNRQPTLHRGSMMAMQVVVRKGKTLRMNLACTGSFNADFDGDEMNIHVPQSIESQAELEMLSATQWHIISPQSSKPNMSIVQDSLLGSYRMTQGVKKITKSQFFNLIGKLDMKENPLTRIQHIRRILKEKGKKVQCFNGKGLISMFLPKDLIYEKANDGDPKEPVLKIWRGVLYEGTLNKVILGASHNSLIQVINKEYGAAASAHFIDCVQFISNGWLMIEGFTVGLGDCLVTSTEKQQEIHDVIQKCYIEAEGLKSTTTHPNIREMRINASLNKAKDIGLRIAKGSLAKNNNFLSTVHSGSKGAMFNIAQITGLLGQQNLKGNRVPMHLSHGRRTLPHYPFEDLSPEMEYESRGFIASSFIHGLNPREFYFHAMSGREGISDTAMGTATSGYMQRRIVKLTEDIKIQYDGTVRDTVGNIYQVAYGETGIDPCCTVKVGNKQEICDVSRMVQKLNMQYEVDNSKKKKK